MKGVRFYIMGVAFLGAFLSFGVYEKSGGFFWANQDELKSGCDRNYFDCEQDISPVSSAEGNSLSADSADHSVSEQVLDHQSLKNFFSQLAVNSSGLAEKPGASGNLNQNAPAQEQRQAESPETTPSATVAETEQETSGTEHQLPGSDPAGIHSVSGQVQNQDGFSLADVPLTIVATVSLDDGEGEKRHSYSAVTDATGHFQINQLPESQQGYRVEVVSHEEYQGSRITLKAGEFGILKLELKRYLTVSGRLISQYHIPLAGVDVVPMSHPGLRIKTDENGEFAITISQDRAGQERQIFKFKKEGFRKQFVSLSTDDWDKDDIRWEIMLTGKNPLTKIDGVVIDNTGREVGGALVKISSPATRSYHKTVTDNNGHFQLQGIEVSDDYRLRVYPGEGLEKYARNDLEVPETGLSLDITIE